MKKDHIQRVNDWNDFKAKFIELCGKNNELYDLFERKKVYFSGDIEDPKKSQLVLAFTEIPINTYKTDNGGIKVEFQWGCRLFYVLEYNGSITCYIKDYDEVSYKLNTYSSARKITVNRFNRNVSNFLLVEKNTSATTQSTRLERVRFLWLKSIGQKNGFEIIVLLISKLPILKNIVKKKGVKS